MIANLRIFRYFHNVQSQKFSIFLMRPYPNFNSRFRIECLSFITIFLIVVGHGQAIAQSFTTLETVFTPSTYPDGALNGTLFLPSTFNGTAVVLVHELGADRSTMDVWGDTLAAHGFLALSIDYPDSSYAMFPQPVRAVVAGAQFLRSLSAESPAVSRVGVLGRSLGAILAADAKMDDVDYSLLGIDSEYSGQVDFDVLLYGLYDFQHFLTSTLPLSDYIYAYFSGDASLESSQEPVLHASDFTCPILLIHGTDDSVLEYQQSLSFYDSLIANGQNANLITVPGAGHLFETNGDSFTTLGLPIKDSVLRFLTQSDLGVANNSQMPNLQAFPNPLPQGGMLHIPDQSGNGTDVIASDIMGRRTLLSGDRDGNYINVYTQQLAPGIYFFTPEDQSPSASPIPIVIVQ
jgi:acetyl esterase/lipase